MKAEVIELENDLCEFYTKNKEGKGSGYGRRKIEAFVNFKNKELIEICTKLIDANKRESVIETIEWSDELEDYLNKLKK